MAIADTARLIASLELEDKFSKTADKYNKALGAMEKNTGTLDKVGFQVGRGARNVVDNVGRIAVVGAGLVASQVALGVRSLAQLEEVKNQTEAVITSTGGAAKVTTEQVRALSESLEDLTTVDDKAVQAGANMLLTFTNIRNEVGKGNDIFNQATETLVDLSVAMGTEPKAAAIQLGKALNDPIKGITALTRVGVTFTEKQKKQIETMVEAGDVMGAQKVILAELNKEFGKSGEAFGKGPAADMRRFGDAIEGAQQALATGFLPVIQRVSRLVQEGLGSKQVQDNIKAFGKGLAGGVEDLIDIGLKLPWDAIGQSAKLMGQGAKALLDAFTGLPPWIQTAVLTGWGLNKLTGGALGNIAGTLAKAAFGQIRGGTPATPVFTREVGPGGGIGGAGGPGGIGNLAKILSAPFIAAAGFFGTQAIARLVSGNNPLGDTTKQFGPAISKTGGVQQVEIVKGSGAFNAIEVGITHLRDQVRTSLKENDIHSARFAQKQIDSLLALKGEVTQRINNLIPHLGQTNRALSVANRNLGEGNRRQRELKAGIDQMRSVTGTGFSRTNANLGVTNTRLSTIAAKDFSPNVQVTVPVTNNVSISEVTRVATSTAFASGFTPQLLNG